MTIEKELTNKHKFGKLFKLEQDFRKRELTGKRILVVNLYKGGVTDIQEFNKVETVIE